MMAQVRRILQTILAMFVLYSNSQAMLPISLIPLTGEGDASSVSLPVNSSSEEHTWKIAAVHVYNKFDAAVAYQPSSNPAFVSTEEDKLTYFSLAAKYGSLGLLAHNYLLGAQFFDLQPGDLISVEYADGYTSRYIVEDVKRYQALSPYSPYSSFVDLDQEDVTLSAEQLFYQIYAQKGKLILQTCIEQDGIDSWGRLFIIARPLEWQDVVLTLIRGRLN